MGGFIYFIYVPFSLFFCSEVWNKFLEFESCVGDLLSILKVEKRRAGVLGSVSGSR